MMEKKYYWMLSGCMRSDNTIAIHQEEVTDKHPFQQAKDWKDWQKGCNSGFTDFQLLNWREITEEEYKLWKSIND